MKTPPVTVSKVISAPTTLPWREENHFIIVLKVLACFVWVGLALM